MSWAEGVSVPLVYENGRYKVKAQPYRNLISHTREEWRVSIIDYLSIHPGTTQTKLSRKLGVGWNIAHSILDDLVKEGIVSRECDTSKQKGEGIKYYLINHI